MVSQLRIKGSLHDVAFIGDAGGIFHAVDADTGALLWKVSLGMWTSPCQDLPGGKFGIGGTVGGGVRCWWRDAA